LIVDQKGASIVNDKSDIIVSALTTTKAKSGSERHDRNIFLTDWKNPSKIAIVGRNAK